jgi:VanZ family protein
MQRLGTLRSRVLATIPPRVTASVLPPRRVRDLPGTLSDLPAGIIGWLLLVVLCLTWMPAGTGAPHIRLLEPPSSPLDILINLLLFVPMGLVVVTSLRHRAGARAAVIWTAVLAAMLSLGVEVGQLRAEGRTVSLFDPVLNTLGATLAGTLAVVRPYRIQRPTVVFACMVLLVHGTFGAVLFVTREELRLARWNSSFEITVGEEVGGGRTYIGQVLDGRVCSGAGGERRCAEPGAGPEEREALVAAAEASQRIELAATVVSGSAEQSGPARIVTFSDGPEVRNATLAQTVDTLILRVRTPRMGDNGHLVAFHLPRAVPVGEPVAVSAAYSPGRVAMRAISSTGSVAAASLPVGVLSSWWLFRPLQGSRAQGRHVRPVEPRSRRGRGSGLPAAGLGNGSIPAAALAGGRSRGRRHRSRLPSPGDVLRKPGRGQRRADRRRGWRRRSDSWAAGTSRTSHRHPRG